MAIKPEHYPLDLCDGPTAVNQWDLDEPFFPTRPLIRRWSLWKDTSGRLRFLRTSLLIGPLDQMGSEVWFFPQADYPYASLSFGVAGEIYVAAQTSLTQISVRTPTVEPLFQQFNFSGVNPVLFNTFVVNPNVSQAKIICFYRKENEPTRIFARVAPNFSTEYLVFQASKNITELHRVLTRRSVGFKDLYGRFVDGGVFKLALGKYDPFVKANRQSDLSKINSAFIGGDYSLSIFETGDSSSANLKASFSSGSFSPASVFVAGVDENEANIFSSFMSGSHVDATKTNSAVDESVTGINSGFVSGALVRASKITPSVTQQSCVINSNFIEGTYEQA